MLNSLSCKYRPNIGKQGEEFFARRFGEKIPVGQRFRSGEAFLPALLMCVRPGLYVSNSCTMLHASTALMRTWASRVQTSYSRGRNRVFMLCPVSTPPDKRSQRTGSNLQTRQVNRYKVNREGLQFDWERFFFPPSHYFFGRSFLC